MTSSLTRIMTAFDKVAETMVGADSTRRMIQVEKASKIVIDALKETNDSAFPISKMLTVSTSHVTQETFEAMSLDGIKNEIMLPIYAKTSPDNGENYGLIVYLEPGLIDWNRIPEDLAPVVKFSLENNCDILCLDSDGMEMENLHTYEWED